MIKLPGERRAIFFENARVTDPKRGEVGSTLRLAGARIAGINVAPGRDDVRFDLDGAYVIPGLVNAHDHLELNNFPRIKFRPCYGNAREWAADVNARLDSDPDILKARQVPLEARLWLGGIKNLLAGVTTVAHHNPLHAPLKKNFPVQAVTRYGWAHSLYLTPDFAESYHRTARNEPWMIHLAEGTDEEARGELTHLDEAGALQDNTVLIHGVGLDERDRTRAIEKGAALVWCPSSNCYLLGETARVREFSDVHLLGVGSDSRLTGERDLLDELRAARETGQIDAKALFRAVTMDATRFLRMDNAGRIERGRRADLVILPGNLQSAAEAIGTIRRSELRAVIVGGDVCVGDSDFAPLIKDAVRVALDGREKMMVGSIWTKTARGIGEEGLFAA